MVLVFFFFGGLPDPESELAKALSLFLFSPAVIDDFFEVGAVVRDGSVLIMLVSTMVPPSFRNRTLEKQQLFSAI